MNIAEKLLAGC